MAPFFDEEDAYLIMLPQNAVPKGLLHRNGILGEHYNCTQLKEPWQATFPGEHYRDKSIGERARPPDTTSRTTGQARRGLSLVMGRRTAHTTKLAPSRTQGDRLLRTKDVSAPADEKGKSRVIATALSPREVSAE